MIKAGGIWVSPAEVEAVLVEHPDVLEAAVVGVRDGTGLETTVAFLVARNGRTIETAAIDAHCRERMAAFKRPRRLVLVDELPKTATGKVRRVPLREQLGRRGLTPSGLGAVHIARTRATRCSSVMAADTRARRAGRSLVVARRSVNLGASLPVVLLRRRGGPARGRAP